MMLNSACSNVSCSHEQFLVSAFTHILMFYDNVPDPFTNVLVIINIRQKMELICFDLFKFHNIPFRHDL